MSSLSWLKSHSGLHYVASTSAQKYITHRFLHSWVTHACTELPILLETFEPHRVVKTFRLSLSHTLRALKLWPLLSLFFQLDRKTGGRKRRNGEGGGHNLFGINCTMKSLFSGPTCCSSLSVCVVCLSLNVCVCTLLQLVMPVQTQGPYSPSLQMAAVTATDDWGLTMSRPVSWLSIIRLPQQKNW